MSGFSFGAGGGEAKKPAGAGGFSFGGAQPTATPAAGGTSAFSFGTAATPAATTTTSTAAPSFSFGTAATPAATTTTTSTAAPSFSFGTKPASTTTTTSTGGGLFGAATTATTTTGGGGLFGAAAAAAAAAAPAAAATTTGGGGLFGAAPAATPTAATPAAPSFSFGAAKPATTTPAAGGSGLFGAAKPATTTTEAAKLAATGGSLFGAAAAPASTPAAPTTTTAAAATTTKSTSSALAPPPVNLSRPTDLVGKSVGETLQYWNKELAQRTADFKKKAQIIADWDEQIVERRRELFEMQVDLVNAKSQQDVMERQIRVIEQHQEDTERALTDMENGVDRLYQQLGETLDVDRDVSSTARLYGLAEQVSGQILQIGNSLRDASKTISRYQAMQEQRGLRKGDGDATRSLVSALNNQLSALKHIDRQLDLATNRIEKDRFLSSSK
jgi:nuclear pore complex protein Nup62